MIYLNTINYNVKKEINKHLSKEMLDKTLGNPTIKNATVEGVIVKHGKGSKIKIFKNKPNTTSTRKNQGHRQPYTKVEIKKIG